ncbi:glyoxalase [Mycobacterium sp. 852013-50091_SCH5140682]|uniref:VOC family protein n=1 Tax=Mycobacterium sp. 852013-50091_SCH5140682 TaxID=1834109 RepID=UPI0007EBE444|nr:VOC family protein [Mycobacterium sp. 852013-50091_SCH5140682]OBB99516.1 glyoxalase [Mycobacterium sp. 852013-50091_SCH5140682]
MSRMFGNINQIGYVVRDIHASMDRWVQCGVGPWFYIENVVTDYFRYRGADSEMTMSIALANSGDVQLELIQPTNDAPSMYRDFLASGREGAQHISYWSTDYQGLYDRALAAGYVVGQEGCIGGEQGRFAYLDTEFDQGTVIEISDISGPKGQMFAYVREVAANWDGAEPIRVLG